MRKEIIIITVLIVSVFASPSYIVLNGLGETMSKGEWLNPLDNDITTVGSMPNQVEYIDDENLYVVASGDNSIERYTITGDDIILRDNYSLPAGSNPYMMYVYGDTIYTSLWVHGGIAAIDINTGDSNLMPPFCNGPQGIYADNNFIYVTAGNMDPITYEYGLGELWKIGRDMEIISMMEIGANPQQIISGPDGYLHIICTGNYDDIKGWSYIVDPVDFEVVDSVYLGGTPQRIDYDPTTNIVYSATSLYESWVGVPGSGRILAYDGITHEIIWNANDSVNAINGTGLVGLDVFDGVVYVPSMDSSFLEIVEIDSTGVSIIGEFTTGYGPLDVAVFDATGIDETAIIPVSIFLSAHPNPFNSAVTITAPAGAEIEVFDVSGRKIADAELVEAGAFGDCKSHPSTGSGLAFIWQPGENIGSGVYLVRAKIGEQSVSKRIVYLK